MILRTAGFRVQSVSASILEAFYSTISSLIWLISSLQRLWLHHAVKFSISQHIFWTDMAIKFRLTGVRKAYKSKVVILVSFNGAALCTRHPSDNLTPVGFEKRCFTQLTNFPESELRSNARLLTRGVFALSPSLTLISIAQTLEGSSEPREQT